MHVKRRCVGGAGDDTTILVVEDNRNVRDAAVALLQTCGYAVVTASNGRDAIEILRTGAVLPRLIILDLTMPVMDGFAFRAAQLSDPTLASIPIIVVSAAGPAVPEAAERMHAAAVIAKPVDGNELVRLVAAHCERR